MKTVRIGFVGGCLAHQSGIPYPRLFHRVLSSRLENEHGLRVRMEVAEDYDAEPRDRLEHLLQRRRVDAIILHRSTLTFSTKTMVIFHGARGYVIHPRLLPWQTGSWLEAVRAGFPGCLIRAARAGLAADSVVGRDRATPAPVRVDSAGHAGSFRFKNLTWTAGEWLGLVAWAIRDEERIVREVHGVCAAARMPLLVLGPGTSGRWKPLDRFVHRLDRRIGEIVEGLSGTAHVSLVSDIDGSGRSIGPEHYLNPVHHNDAGHLLIASRLEPHVRRLLADFRHRLAEDRGPVTQDGPPGPPSGNR